MKGHGLLHLDSGLADGICPVLQFRAREVAEFGGAHEGRIGSGLFRTLLEVVAFDDRPGGGRQAFRSEEHTSELQSLMRISYAVFCLKKKTRNKQIQNVY